MFLASAVILSTFTALPSSTSYRVTVGPRINPVTLASISNCKKTSVKAATTKSFALLFALAAGPARKISGAGSSYLTSAVNSNCSGRLTATVLSFAWATGARDSSTGNSSSKLSSSSSSSSSSAGRFHSATTGDSNGGVSVTSKSSTNFSVRFGRFDHNQVLAVAIRVKTSLTGVAVITNTPKTKIMSRTG